MNTDTILPKWAKLVNTNLLHLLSSHDMDGPVCHVGSLINKESVTDHDVAKWRNNFSGLRRNEFVGVDIFDGMNVDVVADLCRPDFPEKHSDLLGRFGLVFCSALLEHVKEPHAAARNISSMIKSGGHLYFAGPWVWGFHPYPDDYWRLSLSALETIFSDLEVVKWWYSGTVKNVGLEVRDRKLERKLFLQRTVTGPASLITDQAMPYLNLGVIARKPG